LEENLAAMVKWSERLFRKIARFARHRAAACLLAAAIPIGLRVATLPLLPMPYPLVHDEYSYLLGADTFASGRLANPPHPMWEHFETFHENFQPTYSSKYPPGQALFMAFGQKFLHHPWFGVCLSFGVMCASICWMLQGWMPPVYALLGSLVAIGQFGIFGYWMDSYWGGAVPAIGGSLLLGAVARLAKRSSARASFLGGLGLMVLANSRPYEGFALAVGAAIALLWWRRRTRGVAGLWKPRVLIPGALVCLAGIGWLGYYNYRLTGDPMLLPYALHERTYSASAAIYLLPARPVHAYRHKVIRDFWIDFERGYYLKIRANPLRAAAAFFDVLPFYASPLVFLPMLLGLICFARNSKIRIVIGLVAFLWGALLIEKSWEPHYFAPGAGLVLLPVMFSLRWLRIRLRTAGVTVILAFVACVFGHALLAGVKARRFGVTPPQEIAREKILAAGRPGERHLVIVRYSPDHSPHIEYVFNSANIDKSQIVWARDMGEAKNKELLDYYPDRRVWLLEPDQPPTSLAPYAAGQ
jgi:hypothetical protein